MGWPSEIGKWQIYKDAGGQWTAIPLDVEGEIGICDSYQQALEHVQVQQLKKVQETSPLVAALAGLSLLAKKAKSLELQG